MQKKKKVLLYTYFKLKIFNLANRILVPCLGFAKFCPLSISSWFVSLIYWEPYWFFQSQKFFSLKQLQDEIFPWLWKCIYITTWLVRNCKNCLQYLQDIGIFLWWYRIYLKQKLSSFSFSLALLTTSKIRLSMVSKIWSILFILV